MFMLYLIYLYYLPRALLIFFEKVRTSPLTCHPLHRRPISTDIDFENLPYYYFRICLSTLISFAEVALSLAAKFCLILSVSSQYHFSPPLCIYFSFFGKDWACANCHKSNFSSQNNPRVNPSWNLGTDSPQEAIFLDFCREKYLFPKCGRRRNFPDRAV